MNCTAKFKLLSGGADPAREELNHAFVLLAESVLTFLHGDATGNMLERARLFVAAAEAAGDDGSGHGVPIRTVDFANTGSEDDPTNTIIRGALQMVSALIRDPKSYREGAWAAAYDRGRDELSEGVLALNAKLHANLRKARAASKAR